MFFPRFSHSTRLVSALAALVLVVGVACEAVGVPDAYKDRICPAIAELSGPLVSAVTGVTTAVATGNGATTAAAVDQVQGSVDRIAARLVDVPAWPTGAPAVTDLRKIVDAYRDAIAKLRQVTAGGSQADLQSAGEQLEAARLVAPNLGQHLQDARVVGLPC